MQRLRTGSRVSQLAPLLAGLLLACAITPDARTRRLIGATAEIDVPSEQLQYLARIDTGAANTSLHAVDIVVVGAAPSKLDDVGKPIRFRSVNDAGDAREFSGVVKSVVRITNAQGSELRYQFPLRLRWGSFERQVDVNLRDRSQMDYRLLIGRDWLHDAFVVDVDLSARPGDQAGAAGSPAPAG